jgi:hypothetical protein
MMVSFSGPRGGKLDVGLQAFALLAMKSFAKNLGINRLRTNILVNFHHKLYVDTPNASEGLCESLDQRNFIIDVALYGDWLSTLAHEMVHVKQFARGELDAQLTRWKTKDHHNTEYWNQPWEKEARRLQHKLTNEFRKEYE